MRVLPTGGQVLREAALVIAGAVVAALVISQLPGVRAWINAAWGRDTGGGCTCR